MRKINKTVKWTFLLLLSTAVIIGIECALLYSLIPPEKERMEKYYQRDKEDLNLIVDYLDGLDYSFISINKYGIKEGVMFTGAYSRFQEIDDKQVLQALKRLLKNEKYEVVGKSENTIFFQKWSFIEKERGIAFNDGANETIGVEFLIKSEPLSEVGWYYYESDYEEYRNLH